ncbi:MAG: B12-binding domain-containing radical SAM protein [Candidatus Infernicultor aquiphilus]|uniref:B12-binding domain-containing radical SAM protein n=1 Tax=Candidatus Infernicultor aquiphilus TaxID=1805029 RepID=A0A1J5GIG4_9BACT|nr:TIGR03960 family B12-binding radical SAM protein [bacterium]OIP67702.1 MAG: B12-binding domain-containing radical SAM protein [Candidatus Atribacteria bacterium CG2_30_33_13]PIU25495.1 MAG: B12-binding domain-containing radical SAM protein [Candidatus Atribacteria bacterium CG08_land_8_20_14_0_20_33_29]PIW11646.1 MAG: B12-binding domain-containing radical SAM protein [Candidatus Atribacteria bacterium CG17_big_fil_post_rev_8_21_14_2_50_34_11]PIX34394.1 MAG: B12-binding domain-containing radi
MNIKKILFEELLDKVEKPGRYTGKEYNEIIKREKKSTIKVALAFPDLYEIGMSYLGFKILYEIINKRDDALAERIFSPAVDMENLLRERQIPVFSLETYRALNSFDLVGFTIQHELCFSNILNLLDLGGIPLRSTARKEEDPLIIAGGPGAFNPEPLSCFIDLFVIGEGEEIIGEIIEVYKRWKEKKQSRSKLLEKLGHLEGVYIPSHYKVDYLEDGKVKSITPKKEAYRSVIKKRIISNFDQVFYPLYPIVPNIDVVHDRITLEIFRGCSRGCRFCQAGIIYRPVREKSVGTLVKLAEEILAHTGYEEISLSSLSSSDYSEIERLITQLVDRFKEKGVGVSLPSLRIDTFSVALAQQVQRVRKTGLTFAPEVGTQRLRDVINKNVQEEDLYSSIRAAFQAGWRKIKLYFMIGLPTETDEDVEEIVKLVNQVDRMGREIMGRKININISVSAFVPKSHTPFQWEAQEARESLSKKIGYLKDRLDWRNISFSYPDIKHSYLEAVFARGDRRLGEVLERAHYLGCKFDAWSEQFKFEAWQQAFVDSGLSMEFYVNRVREDDEILPWEHISCGVKKEYLLKEKEKALKGETTPDCRFDSCTSCGVC